jgi:lipopolysaccharide assembly outer membrane protein LptD (OstA)
MFLIIISILISCSFAENTGPRFSADKYSRKASGDKVNLDGNVKILYNDTSLKADHVELNSQTQDFKATGNVDYDAQGTNIKASKITGNLNSPKGKILDGTIINKKDIFEGAEINRVSKERYLIREGRYTSCSNKPPDWRLYGNNIDLTNGEYAHMKDVVIETFGLPITYLPYLVVPIKDERQSGLLPPDFGFGTDGFNIDESFFWAISRSHDATFTLGHYGSRGLKEGFEFRSAFAEESGSELNYFHIDDKKFSNTIYNGEPLGKKQRHGAKLDQQFKLADTTYTKIKLRYVSDDNIPRDFPDEMEGRADPALESKFLLTTHTPNIAYIAEADYYEDLLSRNPMDSNRMQLQKLPELRVKLAKAKLSALMFEGDVSYLNIYRSGPYFDDINNNSSFDNNEFIRKGQRVDVYPRISLPIATDFIKITPQAGVRYDHYIFKEDGHANRTYADIMANISSEISRIYKRGEDKQYRSIKHTIEPFVNYHIIPWVDQSDHPFFDNTNGNISSPMFDSIDSIGKTNLITYGINNRIMAKYIKDFVDPNKEKEEGEGENCSSCSFDPSMRTSSKEDFLDLRERAHKSKTNQTSEDIEDNYAILQPLQWRLYQTYDFLDKTGKPFGYLRSDILATYEWMNILLSNFYNVYTKKLGTSSELFFGERETYLGLGYYHDKTDPSYNIDQFKLRFGFRVWRFGFNTRFILNNTIKGTLKDKIQDKYADVIYYPPSSCWFIKLAATAPYDKPGIQYNITFNLLISGQAIGFGKDDGFWSK